MTETKPQCCAFPYAKAASQRYGHHLGLQTVSFGILLYMYVLSVTRARVFRKGRKFSGGNLFVEYGTIRHEDGRTLTRE
eukprot:4777546-Prymnesium_polylepis.1